MTESVYSPGLEGVVAGETAISTIAGGLSYRGYSIEELAEHASFEEVAHLLLFGELPNQTQLADLRAEMAEAWNQFPGPLLDLLRILPADSNRMDVLRSGTSLLAHWDSRQTDNSSAANRSKAISLLAQLPLVMAARERFVNGQDAVLPRPDLSLAANTLWMLSGEEPTAEATKSMDVSLILYAEHEFNASTFTSRVVVSTMSDLHSGITAAIGALKGPLHGGANERVMDVLREVGTPENAEPWIRAALAAKQRIMGFGHRVYKTGDPRARFLKPLCAALAEQTGNQAMESMADTIERIVGDEKKLVPNLDWPSARLYYYMGLPVDLYTPLFVLSRVAGWSAHIIEQTENNRLIRPRANYVGVPPREWIPLAARP